MSKLALLWICLAAAAGAILFKTSQQVTDGRQRLDRITADMRREEDSLRVLQAEWSYLNQPDRLEKLVAQYLPLSPMKGKQFTSADSLPLRPVPPAATDELMAASTGDASRTESLTQAAQTAATAAAETASLETAPLSAPAAMPQRKPAAPKRAVAIPAAPAAAPAAAPKPAAYQPAAAPAKAPTTAADDKQSTARSFGDVLNGLSKERM